MGVPRKDQPIVTAGGLINPVGWLTFVQSLPYRQKPDGDIWIFGGQRFAWMTAAPTEGTWAQGDVVWNKAATVGQPRGWLCTVAGTPGTFVSMGNL